MLAGLQLAHLTEAVETALQPLVESNDSGSTFASSSKTKPGLPKTSLACNMRWAR